MPAIKKQVSLRLAESTIRELESIAKSHNVSQADVVAILVRCMYQGEFDGDSIDELFEIAARC